MWFPVLAAILNLSQSGPRDSVLVIKAGALVDVEHGQVLRHRQIVIRGDRIVAILGPTAPVPRGAWLLDQSHSTVLPGLIDLHTLLVGDIQGSSPTAADALLGVAHARATLLAGFTTVRDVGTYRGGIDISLRNAINNGQVLGPRMAVVGPYVTKPGGGGDAMEFSEAAIRAAVDEAATHGTYITAHAHGA